MSLLHSLSVFLLAFMLGIPFQAKLARYDLVIHCVTYKAGHLFLLPEVTCEVYSSLKENLGGDNEIIGRLT